VLVPPVFSVILQAGAKHRCIFSMQNAKLSCAAEQGVYMLLEQGAGEVLAVAAGGGSRQ
jgi:hypothetical protein